MKKLGTFLYIIILLLLIISINTSKLNIYNPPSNDIEVTISEIETGNKLIEISEVNVILIVLLTGVFLFTH
jgi:hypothetical protein